jgi:hypothetical protein
MKIIKKNEGPYVQYDLTETTLSFRNGELILDMREYQRGYPVWLDVCEDKSGGLMIGPSYKYVAQIRIPARTFRLVKKGYSDDLGIEQASREPVPFDVDKVTLALWALEV